MSTSNPESDNADVLAKAALKLFDPNNTGIITEDQCVTALLQVYKEQRFAASSLNHYGQLHKSLTTVLDIMFWAVMSVILQVFLQVNITSYLVPFITMFLTVSFALAPLVGNLFLAMNFVFFMCPYDIGNKIVVGMLASTSPRIVGYVKGISLLYTTICTLDNELMRLPNHALFQERICNLSESFGACFELQLTFYVDSSLSTVDGELQPSDKSTGFKREAGIIYNSQADIDHFLEAVRLHVLRDCRMDWQDCLIVVKSIDMSNSSVCYSVYLTHRDNYQNYERPWASRGKLLTYIRQLQLDLRVYSMKLTQPDSVLDMYRDHTTDRA